MATKHSLFRLTKICFIVWILCIIVFFVSILVGTSFFQKPVTETAFGNSDLYIQIIMSSIVVGVVSFALGVWFFILFDLIQTKILRIILIPIVAFIFIRISGYLYSYFFKTNNFAQESNLVSPSVPEESTEQMKAKVFTLVNEERKKAGLKELNDSQVLDTTATNKANDMFAKNYWDHVSPEGTTPWVLFGNVGYVFREAGENLAKDYLSSKKVVNGWMISPTHKENILNPLYKETGIAVIDGTLLGRPTRIIVQHFGNPYTPNLVASKTGSIIKYKEWCTGNEINVYEKELIVKKSSDGNTYGMTSGDWICYENFLSGKGVPNRTPSRTGEIIPYKEWCTGKDISIYEYELIYRNINGMNYSMTQGDWDCYDSKYKR